MHDKLDKIKFSENNNGKNRISIIIIIKLINITSVVFCRNTVAVVCLVIDNMWNDTWAPNKRKTDCSARSAPKKADKWMNVIMFSILLTAIAKFCAGMFDCVVHVINIQRGYWNCMGARVHIHTTREHGQYANYVSFLFISNNYSWPF